MLKTKSMHKKDSKGDSEVELCYIMSCFLGAQAQQIPISPKNKLVTT